MILLRIAVAHNGIKKREILLYNGESSSGLCENSSKTTLSEEGSEH
jgi:hypothetical protein